MSAACDLKNDCSRWSPVEPSALAAKYDGRVPRYTSYPTAPHFHAGIGEREYRAWLGDLGDDPVSVYFHIPFCQQLCWYCGCNTQVTNRRNAVSDYVDAMLGEMALVGHAIGRRARVATVHFGGGTPNSLHPSDLKRILQSLRLVFNVDEGCEIAAELDPRTLTHEWVATAAANGMTRVSLGVQDTNIAVQRAINRVQPLEVTRRAVNALRDVGIASINLDLMYGLPHQTVATIERTVDDALSLGPDRIALFGYAHVPWMKPAQKLILDEILPDAAERYDQQLAAAERLVHAGFVRVGLDHFARADDPLAAALRSGDLARNFQGYTTDGAENLIGFGASSIGRLHQGYVQNATRIPDWRRALEEGVLPVARGIAFSGDDRFRAEVIESLMCQFKVDLDETAERHGFAGSGFHAELEDLMPFAADGLLLLRDGKIVITERGRPFVRSICAVFDRYLERSGSRHSRGV